MKNNQLNLLTIFLSIFFVCWQGKAQLPLLSAQQIDFSNAIYTIKSGDWSDPSVWSSGTVPITSTDVIISENHIIYIDIQGNTSGQIVELCNNLEVKSTAILRMGHDTDNFAKDLRINGSILCNGTFSSGRNQLGDTGDGSLYNHNSRIYMRLTLDKTYISGVGYFHPKSINITSTQANRNLIVDIYNMKVDDAFAIKSDNIVNVSIEKYTYLRIMGTLGLTGSTYQYSSDTSSANLNIKGIVISEDVSLFSKNNTENETTTLTIKDKGILHTQKINNAKLNKKTEAAGFNFTIVSGGLFKLGEGVNFENLTLDNPNFVLTNNGEIRKHYTETISTKTEITKHIDAYDPNLGADVSQIKDIFGASHIAGWYNFTERPYMLEGLDKYKDFGSSAIKTTLTAEKGKMFSAYPFNHTWPEFNTLKEVAQHIYIDSLFKRSHIKTHTFWTTSRNKSEWKKGPDFDHASFLNEEQQFYDLTKYLLETYGDMDKKFIYQNWEGDWMLRGLGVIWETDPSLIPDDVEWDVEGMARMFRARQRGTERARDEFPNATAKVYAGIEFNKLWWNDNGTRKTMMDSNIPCVVADVASKTRIDIVSWSAYDGNWTNSEHPHGHAMWKGLEMARYYISETKELPGNFPIQIGEFAINENPPYNGNNTKSIIKERYGRYIGVALGLNLPNFYLWNLYCSGQQGAPDDFKWEKGVQYDTEFLYEWMDGKWLLEPDGSWGHAADFLMELWSDSLSSDYISNQQSKIVVYPNPTTDYFKVMNFPNNGTIKIYNQLGNLVFKATQTENKTHDISNLPIGIYIIQLTTPKGTITTKPLIIN